MGGKRLKFKIFLAVTGLSMLLLTGCASSISLTDNESDVVAEYIAGLMFKYDKNYEEALILPEESEEEVVKATPTPTQGAISDSDKVTTSQNSNHDANLQAVSDFTEVIGVKNLKIEYSGYEVKDSISDDYFNIESGKEKNLVIVKFKLINTSSKDIPLNLTKSNISYQLDINTGNFQKPLLTFLDNDLRLIDTTVKANSTLDTVLVFDVSDNVDLNVVNVIISNLQKTAIIKLK